MTRTEIIALLQSLDIRPSRRLGQNFLVDRNLLEAIVREAGPREGEAILEIGAGTGVLTRRLLEEGAEVTAVEIDHRLASYLRDVHGAHPRFRLCEGDACKLDYDQLLNGQPFRCVANLPYAISSVFLARMTELRNPPTSLLVLLQREMGDRLRATPGTKEYGALTVKVQLLYRVSRIRSVPPQVFHPTPRVGSSLLRLETRPDRAPLECRMEAGGIARLAFSQRRKRAAKLLGKQFGSDRVVSAFATLDLPPDVRAERIPVDTYVQLAGGLRD